MRRVWAWMAVNFGKHAGIVGVIGLAITLVLGLGATRLDFATGQDSYLNKDEQVYKDNVAYQDLFAGQALLGAREREPDPAAQEARAADALTTLQRLNAVPEDQRTFENPEWIRFLLFDNRGDIRKSLRPFFTDESHAQLVTRLVGNASLEDEGTASERVQEITLAEPFERAEVTSTGAPVLLKDLNDYLRGGMLTLGAIAVGIMVVILLLLFGVRWRLLPLAVILIGLAWAFGLAGYLGIPLSVVTIA